jgi:hypothetical protein
MITGDAGIVDRGARVAPEAAAPAAPVRAVHQEALTVVANITPGQVGAIARAVGTIAGDVEGWRLIPFDKMPNVHFARIVVFDEAVDLERNRLPAQLALMTNVDAPLDAHLTDLATIGAEGLDAVFGHCEGYPEPRARTTIARVSFLRRHHRRASAFYVNRQGRTVAQILGEEALRRRIGDYLDAVDVSGLSPDAIRGAIVDFVRAQPALAWALDPPPPLPLAWRVRQWGHIAVNAVAALALAPLLLVLLPIFVLLLRAHERRDVPDTSRAAPEVVNRFREDEDYWTQNQIVAAGLFKPGWFRRITALLILRLTEFACRHIYNSGSLAGLNTIHFARWVPLDGGRRLFFSSNYDGSLESYMDDFIDKAAWGLNAIFSSGDGFPRTCLLFCGGITDEQAYKRFLPTRQVQSRVWYSAYPYLSTKNIANNSLIREGLSGRMDAGGTRAWLARFGAGNQLPRPGLIARILDSIPWDRLCRSCR